LLIATSPAEGLRDRARRQAAAQRIVSTSHDQFHVYSTGPGEIGVTARKLKGLRVRTAAKCGSTTGLTKNMDISWKDATMVHHPQAY